MGVHGGRGHHKHLRKDLYKAKFRMGVTTLRSAYFSCIGGASGDMILGAVIDCGVSLDALLAELAKLNAEGYAISARRGQRGGVSGTLVSVELSDEAKQPRHWRDFIRITRESSLPDSVVSRACEVFRRLGEAESRVHGTTEGGDAAARARRAGHPGGRGRRA